MMMSVARAEAYRTKKRQPPTLLFDAGGESESLFGEDFFTNTVLDHAQRSTRTFWCGTCVRHIIT